MKLFPDFNLKAAYEKRMGAKEKSEHVEQDFSVVDYVLGYEETVEDACSCPGGWCIGSCSDIELGGIEYP